MQIRSLNNKKGLVSQRIFVDKLKPLLSEKKRGLLNIYNEEKQYGILKNYFIAIKIIFPQVWGKSLLIRAKDFNSLLLLLPAVLRTCLGIYKNFKTVSIIKMLKPSLEYNIDHNDTTDRGLSSGEKIANEVSFSLKGIKPSLKIKL